MKNLIRLILVIPLSPIVGVGIIVFLLMVGCRPEPAPIPPPPFEVDYDEVKILYFGGSDGDTSADFFSSTRKFISATHDSNGGFYVTSKHYLINQSDEFTYSYSDDDRNQTRTFLEDSPGETNADDVIIVVAYSDGYECSRAYMDWIAKNITIPIRYYFLIDGVAGNYGTDSDNLCPEETHTRNSFNSYWNFFIDDVIDDQGRYVKTGDGLSDTEGRLVGLNGWCQRNELSDLTNCHAAIDNQLVDPSIEMFIKQCLGFHSSSTEADCYRALLYRDYTVGNNEYENISDSVDVTQYNNKE